jgi:hypothetical protein
MRVMMMKTMMMMLLVMVDGAVTITRRWCLGRDLFRVGKKFN